MLKFTEEHEWLKIDGDVATVGITSHAAEQLGDLVFVELPDAGSTFDKGDQPQPSKSSRPPPMSIVRWMAKSSRSTRPSSMIRRWSIPTRWALAGSSS